MLIGFCGTAECISFLTTSAVFVPSTIMLLLGCVLYFFVRKFKRVNQLPHPEYEEIHAEHEFNDRNDRR